MANQIAPPAPLERLEIHVTHACNLFCEGCSHYSSDGHRGMLSVEVARAWLAPWAPRLAPRFFTLLGGEPCLHPHLPDFIPLIRELWPRTRIDILTNGLFLHRQPDLPHALQKAGNAMLCVSIHHSDPDYLDRLRPNLELARRWQRELGLPLDLRPSIGNWTRRYRGHGAGMLPFEDEDPATSWQICPCKASRQIHAGALWKCPALAYLPVQAGFVELSQAWDPYLAYRPLPPTADDREVVAFLDREEEPWCAMCPSARRPFAPPNPLRPVADG